VSINQVDGVMIYVRDVATVADGFQVQTNIVRQDGHRGVLRRLRRRCRATDRVSKAGCRMHDALLSGLRLALTWPSESALGH
jgi:hypothetical protein